MNAGGGCIAERDGESEEDIVLYIVLHKMLMTFVLVLTLTLCLSKSCTRILRLCRFLR